MAAVSAVILALPARSLRPNRRENETSQQVVVVRWAPSHAGEDGALWEHLCMGIFIPDLGVDTLQTVSWRK